MPCRLATDEPCRSACAVALAAAGAAEVPVDAVAIGAPLTPLIETLARCRDYPCDLDRALRAQRRRHAAQHARPRHQRLYSAARRTVRGRAVADDRGRRRRQRDRHGRVAARPDRAACRAWRDDRLRHPGTASDRRRRLALGRLRLARRARRPSPGLARASCCECLDEGLERRVLEATLRRRAGGRRRLAACRRRRSTISTSPSITKNCERSVRSPRAGMQYSEFVFESYRYDPATASLSLRYRFADGPRFEEQLIFDFPLAAAVGRRRYGARPDFPADLSVVRASAITRPSCRRRCVCEAFPLDRHTAEFLQRLLRKRSRRIRLEKPDLAARPLPISCRPGRTAGADCARIAAAHLRAGRRRQGFDRHPRMPEGRRRGSRAVLAGRRAADRRLHRRGRAAVHPGSPPARPRPVEAQRRRRAERSRADHRDLERDRAGLRRALRLRYDRDVERAFRQCAEPDGRRGRRSTISTASRWNSSGISPITSHNHISPRHRLFLAAAAVVGNRDRPAFRPVPAIFRDLPQLQYRVSAIAGRARPALVLRLSEMPVRVPGLGAVRRQAAS